MDVQSCVEFSKLSSYINEMVRSLLAYNEKMSYVLGKTNMYIGVYEYNKNMKKVRFTEYIPRIFLLDEEESKRLSEDDKEFQKFIKKCGKIRYMGNRVLINWEKKKNII